MRLACCAFSSSARLSLWLLRLGLFTRADRGTESLVADDEHRRLRVDVVGRHAAETDHERSSIPATERAEFSGKNGDLSGERPTTRQAEATVNGQTASAALTMTALG